MPALLLGSGRGIALRLMPPGNAADWPAGAVTGAGLCARPLGAGEPIRGVAPLAEMGPLVGSYLTFAAASIPDFVNSAASSLGFTMTWSITIFSGGTGVSLSPVAVLATGRTLVSRTKGI